MPLVVVPQGADQFLQADRVGAAGAGIAVPPAEQDPATIAAAVQRVLAEPGFTGAARRIRDEVEAMPSPEQVAARLVAAVAVTARRSSAHRAAAAGWRRAVDHW